MSDVKRLLEKATPLPWESGTGQLAQTHQARHTALRMVGHPLKDSLQTWQLVARGRTAADAALIVAAVNRLPDYEAAVDALKRIIEHDDEWGGVAGTQTGDWDADIEAGRIALARLREPVPA